MKKIQHVPHLYDSLFADFLELSYFYFFNMQIWVIPGVRNMD